MIDILRKLCPHTEQSVLVKYADLIAPQMEKYGLTTISRKAAFLSQIIHESGGFNATIENLNYSAQGLTMVFGKYFPNIIIANQYARQPIKIANLVYANRMGNGPESSGDGYKYRGRGLIQLTGKNWYTAFSKSLSLSIDDTLAFCETPDGHVASALWYWETTKMNTIADSGDIDRVSKAVNGGSNGLAERRELFVSCVKLLARAS